MNMKRCFVGKIQLPFLNMFLLLCYLMTAGKNCQRVLADEPGSIKNSRDAVGFPATTQKAFKD
jgi:hypothetical protein